MCFLESACVDCSSSLLRRRLLGVKCDGPGFLPPGGVLKSFPEDSVLVRTRSLSANDREGLLGSPYLAERPPRSQAIARCSDVSGAARKESRRLSGRLASAGGRLASANH